MGFKCVVEVHLMGLSKPITLGTVQTRDDFPWAVFIVEAGGAEDEKADPGDAVIYVPEGLIERIEVCYRRADPRENHLGFSIGSQLPAILTSSSKFALHVGEIRQLSTRSRPRSTRPS